MRRITSVVLLLALAGQGWCQSVKLPAEVQAQPGLVTVEAETDAESVNWWAPDGGLQLISPRLLKDSRTAVGFALTPGRYRLQAIVAKGDRSEYAVTVVVVGNVPPTPPVPPGPGPNPPQPPTPPPSPAPIPLPGLRVLILFESGDVDKYPTGQLAILNGAAFHKWLDGVCVQGPKNKEWRIWDADTDARSEAKHWQDALARKRESLPWLIVSNGTTGFEGPLPKTADEAKAVIQKYATAGGR